MRKVYGRVDRSKMLLDIQAPRRGYVPGCATEQAAVDVTWDISVGNPHYPGPSCWRW